VLTVDGELRRTRLYRAHEQAELSGAFADTREALRRRAGRECQGVETDAARSRGFSKGEDTSMGSATRLLLVGTSAVLLMGAGGAGNGGETGRGADDELRRAFATFIKLQSDCDSVDRLNSMIAPEATFVRGLPRGADRDTGFLQQPSCAAGGGVPARISHLRIRTYGGDTAVLVGELQYPEGGGQLFTSVWVQQQGKWLLASEHESSMPTHPR
jgi:hypothetical protein